MIFTDFFGGFVIFKAQGKGVTYHLNHFFYLSFDYANQN
jgi:hypothetical protein